MEDSRLGTPNADASASTGALNRFPSVLVSRANDTVVEVRGSAVDPSMPSVEMSWAGSGAHAPPPAYTPPTAPIPTAPVTYSFVPTPGAPWRRVLAPSAGTPNPQALFVLSAALDPWMAWSQTLMIHEGPDEHEGKLVGSLEVLSGAVVAATMGEVRKSVGTFMFFEQTYQAEQHYEWSFTNKYPHRLLWVLKAQRLTCLHWNTTTKPGMRTSTPVAQFGGDLRHDEITI